jgi:MFS family permease
MIALPIFLQMVLEYNALQAGLSLAPLSLSMFALSLLAGKKAKDKRPPNVILIGFALLLLGLVVLLPIVPRAESGWYLVIPLAVAGCGLGLLVSQLNNYTLSPVSQERVSEAAGVNSAGGSFGLSFGLALAGGVMLATLAVSFTNMANQSTVLPTEDKQQIATVLEEDAQFMTNEQLDALLVDQPDDVAAEVVRINTEARPLSLQVALLVPLIAGLLGLAVSFAMMRLPDIKPSASLEGLDFG